MYARCPSLNSRFSLRMVAHGVALAWKNKLSEKQQKLVRTGRIFKNQGMVGSKIGLFYSFYSSEGSLPNKDCNFPVLGMARMQEEDIEGQESQKAQYFEEETEAVKVRGKAL